VAESLLRLLLLRVWLRGYLRTSNQGGSLSCKSMRQQRNSSSNLVRPEQLGSSHKKKKNEQSTAMQQEAGLPREATSGIQHAAAVASLAAER
jgi:hypothetical protein